MAGLGSAPGSEAAPQRAAATHTTRSESRHPPIQSKAGSFDGNRRIGALFYPGFYPGLHVCTASVIATPTRNIIMTAAHCMEQAGGAGYEFAPKYHDGKAPFGVWTTTAAYASPEWINRDGDTHRDFAFLTVAPKMIHGKSTEIQDVVGGNHLSLAAHARQIVQITGYPLGVAGKPITCHTRVYLHKGYPGSHCHGFADGTSGGPWVAGRGGHRHVLGLISGLHQGGCTPAVVYSSQLGKPARRALLRAEHHRRPVSFPARPGDGCSSSTNL